MNLPAPFRDPALPSAVRVADLVARLTVDEKISLLHQHQPPIPRLGLAGFHTGCEALHGVAWLGTATVFPQAVGLGATFDRELVRRVGEAVSTEVRAFRQGAANQDPANTVRSSELAERPAMVSLNVWAPVVNPLRDPRWGRNEEGYSEDPYMVAELATAYCRGLRGDDARVWRTAPLLKHFLAYNAETDRDVMSVTVSPRVLHEYELPAFRGPIEAGVVAGVMPAYNLVNGVPNHVHPLIGQTLRVWGPDLALCSDAQAPSNLVDSEKYYASHAESHAAALKAGIDSYTDNGTDPEPTISRFTEALTRGLVSETDIDAAISRVLLMRLNTGEFDPAALEPYADPYAGITAEVIASAEHAELALEAAQAAVVLLKNDSGVPPLRIGSKTAVIGHLGRRVLTDWYSGTLPYGVSIADGLHRELSTSVTAVDGADVVVLRPVGSSASFGPFLHNDWGTSVQCPVPVHTLQSVETGRYLSLTGDGDRFVENAAATPDGWFVKELFEFHEADDGNVLLFANADHVRRYVRLDAADRLVADAESREDAARFEIGLAVSGIAEAVAAAEDADRVVVVLGNDPHINGRETVDRDGLALPAQQEALLRAVHAANPETTLVLVSSYPYAVTWAAEHIPTILWTCHGGQESGHAVARVLTGTHNPSGRLPQTWYADDAELPARDDYDIIGSGWTYQYSKRDHLFPFGHGLSYTSFDYAAAQVAVSGNVVTVSVDVTNDGPRYGTEIAQLYVHALGHDVERPQRRLHGFCRLDLEPSSTRTAVFDFPVADLAFWDDAEEALVVFPGEYELLIGRSSVDLRTSAVLTVTNSAHGGAHGSRWNFHTRSQVAPAGRPIV